jgi:hypothetical protein
MSSSPLLFNWRRGVSEPPACSLGATPPVGAKKVLGRPGDFLEHQPATVQSSPLIEPCPLPSNTGHPA